MAKLVECVPNFSVSRETDPAVFQGLVDTANSIPGCFVFDVQSDGSHNRCVFTLLGSPEAMTEAAFQLTKKATETIDMRRHTGQHPRMGATDVIPFIPTMDTSVEECVELSKRVAARIWDELRVPSFLYEDSASRPERRNLAACRKGQFEGMPEKLLEPDWAPDYGERRSTRRRVSSPSAHGCRSSPITSISIPLISRLRRRSQKPFGPRTAALPAARPSA